MGWSRACCSMCHCPVRFELGSMPFGQCKLPRLCPAHLHLPPSVSLSLSTFFLQTPYFVQGFCSGRSYFAFTHSLDWLILFLLLCSHFNLSAISFYDFMPYFISISSRRSLFGFLAPSISNVQTVLANQHQVYLMFR